MMMGFDTECKAVPGFAQRDRTAKTSSTAAAFGLRSCSFEEAENVRDSRRPPGLAAHFLAP
jgi:hypothetical protein